MLFYKNMSKQNKKEIFLFSVYIFLILGVIFAGSTQIKDKSIVRVSVLNEKFSQIETAVEERGKMLDSIKHIVESK